MATSTGDATCPSQGTESADYAIQVAWDSTPTRISGSTLSVSVTRAGGPVVGARLCFAASTAPAACNCVPAKEVKLDATEVSPGLYEAKPDFTNGGVERWGGSIALFQADTLSSVKQFVFETR